MGGIRPEEIVEGLSRISCNKTKACLKSNLTD